MNDQTIEYYEKRAGEYDKIYYRDDPVRQGELKGMYDLSTDLFAGQDVLDLACGTGFWTRIISEKAKSIVGIDINPATIKEAEKKEYGCPTKFILSDIYRPSKFEKRFGGLLMTFLLSHIKREDIQPTFDLYKKYLAEKAEIFVCDNNLLCELIPELIWDENKRNTYKERKLENGEKYMILKNYFEKNELLSLFENWGKILDFRFDEYYWSAAIEME